jgi:hypothetical protein
MATGVVSIACQLLGLRWIAAPLFGVAWTSYLVLWGLMLDCVATCVRGQSVLDGRATGAAGT